MTMFIIILKFSENKSLASAFMEGHNQWIRRGFDEGIFLMVGSLKPSIGGAIIASGVSRESIEHRVNDDPFVAENIVVSEILEIEPRLAHERLQFLLQ